MILLRVYEMIVDYYKYFTGGRTNSLQPNEFTAAEGIHCSRVHSLQDTNGYDPAPAPLKIGRFTGWTQTFSWFRIILIPAESDCAGWLIPVPLETARLNTFEHI